MRLLFSFNTFTMARQPTKQTRGPTQRRSQGGCWRGSSTPLSDQNIDVYFL